MSKKILIVDDLSENIQIIVSIFEKYTPEHELFVAPNGETALKITSKILPDIIITDWDMPKMNGIELIKIIKKNKDLKDIPIIIATGVMTSVEYLQTALETGAVDYVKKPINEVELVARTKSALKLAETNKQILEKKNQELIENTLFLVRNNEFNKKITIKLQELTNIINKKNKKANKIIQEVSSEIEEKIKMDSWKRFNTSFSAVYKNFYKNLLNDFPSLTKSEIKISIFLKIGMSSKDIAAMLFITPESVKVARSRLRKKLKIGSNVNFQIFFSKY